VTLEAEPVPQETALPAANPIPSVVHASQSQAPGDYPRITRIEQQILGRTYPNDPVKVRLARLEQKAFGAVSSTDDLGGRTDALAQYAKFFNGSTTSESTTVPQNNENTYPSNNYTPSNSYHPNYTPNNSYHPSYTPSNDLPHRSAYDVGGEEHRPIEPPRKVSGPEAERRAPERRPAVTRRPSESTDAMVEKALEHDQPDKKGDYFRYVKKTVEDGH
jgi:hypothetical protein